MTFLKWNLYQWLGAFGFIMAGGFWSQLSSEFNLLHFVLGMISVWFGEYYAFHEKNR